MRRAGLQGDCLRLLRQGAKGLKIGIIRKVLIATLLVGLCNAITAQTATPLMATMEMRAQYNPKFYAHVKVIEQWNSKAEFACLEQLWQKESNWNPKAHNKSSGAFGIAQFMPETWGNYKFPYKPKEASIQITAGLRYITKRYGSPCEAWNFWQKQAKRGNPWY
jgi:SLT domain-containing protein